MSDTSAAPAAQQVKEKYVVFLLSTAIAGFGFGFGAREWLIQNSDNWFKRSFVEEHYIHKDEVARSYLPQNDVLREYILRVDCTNLVKQTLATAEAPPAPVSRPTDNRQFAQAEGTLSTPLALASGGRYVLHFADASPANVFRATSQDFAFIAPSDGSFRIEASGDLHPTATNQPIYIWGLSVEVDGVVPEPAPHALGPFGPLHFVRVQTLKRGQQVRIVATYCTDEHCRGPAASARLDRATLSVSLLASGV